MRYVITMLLVLIMATGSIHAQEDTLMTRLREVSVIGVKQNARTDLSAVTTISAAETQRLGILAMKDVSALAPNFFMPQYGTRMTSSVYVRGLGARIDQPVVGLSVDGVPYLNKDSYDFDLFDIRSIEVLRGAQSILNGRNTMAGQINITTLSPWQYRGVRAMAEYGRANTARLGVGYYFGVTPALASAVTAYLTTSDGYFRNEYNGSRLGNEKSCTLRWKMSWHPSTRLSVTNTASGGRTLQGGYPYENVATGALAYNDACYYHRTTLADGLTVGWAGKRVFVTSVTSAQYIDDDMTVDQDFTPASYFTLRQKRREWALTEDLYAKGSRGNLSWLGGVFGFYKHTKMTAPVTFKDDGVANLIEKKPNEINPYYQVAWDTRSFVLGSDFTPITKGAAVYGQTEYRLGQWRFELGLRFDCEHASLGYRSHCNTGYSVYKVLPDNQRELYSHNPVNIDDGGHLSHTYSEFLPKIAVGYTLQPGISMFANVAKGYKTGGFNTQMFSDVLQQRIMEMMGLTKLYEIDDIVSYEPEKSWNYELGFKGDWGRTQFDATLFYISCIDQQLTAFPSGMTTGRIMTNAGKTRSYGAELSAAWQPSADLTLRASYGYTNARFVKYHNGIDDFSGKRLPYAPANTLFASADYQLPLSFGDLRPSLGCEMRGVGDIYWEESNTVHQPFYAVCGANLTLTAPRWSLHLWADNITGTRYNTFYFVSMGNAFVQRARPTTWGITLRYNLI